MNLLYLDEEKINKARNYALQVALDTQKFIDQHTTVSVERTVCRLLGVDGVNDLGVPYPNIIVDQVLQAGKLDRGVARYIAGALFHTNYDISELGELISNDKIDITKYPDINEKQVYSTLQMFIDSILIKIKENASSRTSFMLKYPQKEGPLLYVIVATGNIYEDVVQAKAAAKAGADIIAVIRSTGQSLLDFVPYGPTTEGFGGTYATQENFRIMREALDEIGEELNRYIMLVNYASGLCMPEIAAMGAIERLDMMLNDSLYGILFRDINEQRTFVDQYFSRVINAYSGIIINTGEDNYLTTSDAVTEAHTVLASQFINEQFAKLAYMKEEQMGLGHAFEIDPNVENGFLYELAQAEMAREIFPKAPLKYMPPTKYMTGNIFKGHVQNTLFNIVTKVTNQRIHLLGMLTEAVHTPFMSDRYLAIENASYINTTMKDIRNEIQFRKDGIIVQRAHQVLDDATNLLQKIANIGIFETIEQGIFAGIKREKTGGKGLDGVVKKHESYVNPVLDAMIQELREGSV
ncbi:lysine 5,6-aminomutase subunit alpha [Candidatus Xianfuyuplasma coldseepsis]|uniref:D-lysine 5,6-aminomutase subunit alpha n=1 Tax=Candidatus Xianfuyuplasma coldseepsis TaxID=2782163 RepID=A0A7L7KNM0_9MOLU|nr:lysine 5,6-aminomutase subunit alpha [Xianfuyuplasma coldseepsis]QMS84340.1 D-lysine 5,6-aminomutase subunit alpha [Xianfuyuplasma coldseepsis]